MMMIEKHIFHVKLNVLGPKRMAWGKKRQLSKQFLLSMYVNCAKLSSL